MKTEENIHVHPSFVCIGAQKAGTTWLYDNLNMHPDIWLPDVKEIHFFDSVCPHEQLLGVEVHNHLEPLHIWRLVLRSNSLKKLRWLKKFYFEPKTIEWYYDIYSMSPDDKCTGDITPAYSTLDEKGVSFAHRILPESCKIFIILRNPVERIWSAVKMNTRWRGDDVQDVSSAKILDEMRTAGHKLRTDYCRTINIWQKYFSGRFRIFLFDDLIENPADFLATIQDYIGVGGFVDNKKLLSKSNADRRKIEISSEIKEFALEEYLPTIENLDTMIPGIKARWLG